jgi:hypothetical protein
LGVLSEAFPICPAETLLHDPVASRESASWGEPQRGLEFLFTREQVS